MGKSRNLTASKIAIYCIIFFAIWTVRELIIRPIFLDSLNGIVSAIAETLMKISVWTIPALILVKHYEDDMWISLKEMLTHKVKWLRYTPILIAFFLYYSFGAWFSFGDIRIHPDLKPVTLISAVLFVGITEEIAFRAFLLNAFLKKMKMWYAILLTAAIFIPIHYPFWIYQGFDLFKVLEGSVVVLICSTIFSLVFIKSKNIFVPIILHMSWNLFTKLFFG